MDCEVSSAALIMPRLGKQISHGLNTLKDHFMLNDTLAGASPLSPLFQTVEETSSAEIIDFHHQEEVVETTTPSTHSPFINPAVTSIPMDDLDSIDANDLFSFFLDENGNKYLPEIKPAESLVAAFDSPRLSPSAQLPPPPAPFSTNLDIPLDILDLLDPIITTTELKIPRNHSDSASSLSDPPSVRLMMEPSHGDAEAANSYSESEEGEEDEEMYERYCSVDDEYAERAAATAVPSRKKRRAGGSRGMQRHLQQVYLHNEDLAQGKPGQKLVLTAEERRLLVQMGQRVPCSFPLTRAEERAIRTMRRKIRNKMSAKASRARRQEYMASLESRVVDCHKENQRLRSRVTELEKDKRGLLSNLRQMRSYVARLISGMPNCLTQAGFSSSETAPDPLLPLHHAMTTPSSVRRGGGRLHGGLRGNNSNAGGGGGFSKSTSLLVVALMILASSTLMPLPDMDPTKQQQTQHDVPSPADMLSGRSRMLLNSINNSDKDDQINYNQIEAVLQELLNGDVDGFDSDAADRDHSETSALATPTSDLSASDLEEEVARVGRGDPEDDIPVIIGGRLPRAPGKKILQAMQRPDDEQMDPFLLPSQPSKVATSVKRSPLAVAQPQSLSSAAYPLEDL